MKKKMTLSHQCTDKKHDCEKTTKTRFREFIHELIDGVCDSAELESDPDVYFIQVFYNLRMNIDALEKGRLELSYLAKKMIESKEKASKKKVKKK